MTDGKVETPRTDVLVTGLRDKYAFCPSPASQQVINLARQLETELSAALEQLEHDRSVTDVVRNHRDELLESLGQAERERDEALTAAFNRGLKAGNELSVSQQEAIHELRERAESAEQERDEVKLQWTGMKDEVSICHQKLGQAERRLAAVEAETIERCAKVCEKRAEIRWQENGYIEPDTNASYYPGKAADWHQAQDEEDENCASAIRAIAQRKGGSDE